MKTVLALGACLAVSLVWAASTPRAGVALSYRVVATISASQLQRLRYPAPKGAVSKVRGSFVETVSSTSASGSWKLMYSGTTGAVKEVRVVYWTPGVAGSLVSNNHELCSGIYVGAGARPRGCKSGATGTDHFPTPHYAQEFVTAAKRGKAWVVLLTAKNPTGEAAGVLKLAR